MNTMTNDIRVMTSGAFTAALLELIPRLETPEAAPAIARTGLEPIGNG